MQEQEITALLAERREEGMDALLRHYGPLMRYVISGILQDPRDREECLSEAAMQVWEHIGQFSRQRGSWNAWLTAVARNTALNHARKNARHAGAEELTEHTAAGPSPEILLPANHRPDRCGAGHDGAGGGGEAVQAETAAEEDVGG